MSITPINETNLNLFADPSPVRHKRCRRCHINYPETMVVTVHGTNYCDGDGTNNCFTKIQNNGCPRGDC